MFALSWLRGLFFPKKNPRPNLGLYGDLDDVELLRDVEKAFEVQFNDEEACTIRNVGEFFDLATKKVGRNSRELTWNKFTKVLEPHGTMAAMQMTRGTEFFR